MIDKHALNLVIRQLSDEELKHELQQISEKAKNYQSMAARLNREAKRRQREAKNHV